MFETAVMLDSKIHAEHRVVPVKDYLFARNVLTSPVSASEILRVSREFPIVFPVVGKFLPVALMGYEANANLYVSKNGTWSARYIPAHLRRYPFVLGERGTSGEYVMMVESGMLTTKKQAGEPLFVGGDIPQGGVVDRARKFLVGLQNELDQTEVFLKPLKDANILVPQVFTVNKGEKTVGQVKDFNIVDRKKLIQLDNETLSDWVRNGLMALIFAHLQSLDMWNGQKLSARSGKIHGKTA